MSRKSPAGISLPPTSDSRFETELYGFLAELSKTSDVSSLGRSLARLRLAMLEQVNKTDNVQEGAEGKTGLDFNVEL